jgi:hypothetical protein
LTHVKVSRRDFGRLLGVAGLGVAAPTLVGGRPVRAATRTWRTSGSAGAGLGGFDTAVKTLMQARNIPGGQLAVMRKGKLILARGYTWSDDTALSVQPTSCAA